MLGALLLALAAPLGCAPDALAAGWTLRGATMGTTWSLKVPRPPAGLARDELRAGVEAVLERVNAQMSTYREDSELSSFNRSTALDWQPVSPELAQVVDEALRIAAVSDGAFDPTVAPLVDLWGFGPPRGEDRVPTDAEIAAARASVGCDKLRARLAPPALAKSDPTLRVDLSAIAKGHGVDRVADLVASLGVADFLVEIGGELRARGRNASGEPWRIAIERPSPGERAAQRVIALEDAAMATSGDYRNYFERDGARYSHTIVPSTGRPIAHGLASVTVVAPTAARADALATALMVLGPDAGLALAERESLEAYLIVRAGDGFVETHTPAFARRLLE